MWSSRSSLSSLMLDVVSHVDKAVVTQHMNVDDPSFPSHSCKHTFMGQDTPSSHAPSWTNHSPGWYIDHARGTLSPMIPSESLTGKQGVCREEEDPLVRWQRLVHTAQDLAGSPMPQPELLASGNARMHLASLALLFRARPGEPPLIRSPCGCYSTYSGSQVRS